MEEHRASLKDILEHSPFNTAQELLTELIAIGGPTGTKIIIWNLRRTSEEITELDFTTENDIRIICDDLDTSDPEKKIIPIIFGDNKSKQHYGLMMYYNNRLIKAYHRVGCQLKARNRRSVGVIGVIECNHLTPTHNKQDFDNDDAYRNTIQNVASKLREYSLKRRNNPGDNEPIEETDDERPDEDDQLQETSGEGPSGTKRPRRNCDEGEPERDRGNDSLCPSSRKRVTGENRETEHKGEAVGGGERQHF
ncbi:unnamed protein product [Gadus morhua 'NCC']